MADDPQKQGKESKPEAHISFFVRNEAAGKAMARRKVIDRNNEEHEAVVMSWNWRDTWQNEHKRAFVVAKMAKADMLTEVHDSLQKALDEGKPFEEWKKEIVPKLEGKWLGRSVGELWDELSDEEKAKREPPSEKQREKIIAPERLELIFRTNMAVANAAGHYEQLMKTKAIYPYWRYVTRDDARVRDAHRALHNKVFKWDDPFWETYFPPNGFRCRCHVSPLTKRQVERDPKLHIEQSNIAEDADGRKVLDVGGSYYKNNPGWDYNPGDGVNHLVSLAKSNEKGRPAQVQADLEADLAKKEAEEAAAAKAKAEAEKARLERERQAQEVEKRLQEARANAEQRRAEREAKKAERQTKEATAKAEAERLDAKKKAEEAQLKVQQTEEINKRIQAQQQAFDKLKDQHIKAEADMKRLQEDCAVVRKAMDLHPFTDYSNHRDSTGYHNNYIADLDDVKKRHAEIQANYDRVPKGIQQADEARQESQRIISKIQQVSADQSVSPEELTKQIKKHEHRLHRLEQVQLAAENRFKSTNTESNLYVANSRINNLAEGIASVAGDSETIERDKEKEARETRKNNLAKGCSLEHAIAQKEGDIISRELEHARKNGASEVEISKIMRTSQDIIAKLQNNAGDADKAATDLESLRAVYTADVQRSFLQTQREKAEKLYLDSLPASEKKAEKARLAARQKYHDDIRKANVGILGKVPKGIKSSMAENLMLRELDYMLYNFSDNDLEVYAEYSKRYVKKNKYTYPTIRGSYDLKRRTIWMDFPQSLGRSADNFHPRDYIPQYNWLIRFHEEFHHLDAIFGNNYLAKEKNVLLSHPNREGKVFQETLMRETLAFINKARDEAKLPTLEEFPKNNDSNEDTYAAIWDYITNHYPNEKSHALAHTIDLTGLCSSGIIDKDHLNDYKDDDDNTKPHPTDTQKQKWKRIEIHGHDTPYNRRDTTDPKALHYCDETSEALANFTSARLMGESDIASADIAELPQSRQQSIQLIEKMVEAMRHGFVWPE